MAPLPTTPMSQPDDRIVAAIEAQTVATGRAMDSYVLPLIAAVVFVAG